MIPGQLIALGQLTDLGVNFASVHGLAPVTVHISFSLPRGDFERRVTGNPPCEVKATSHSTIFDIPTRPVREDQRYRRRFTR